MRRRPVLLAALALGWGGLGPAVAPAAAAAPSAVAFGPDGTVYVGDAETGVLTTYDRDGKRRGTLGGGFGPVAEVDVDKDSGQVYVLDATNRVLELGRDGRALRTFGLGRCTEPTDTTLRGGVSVAEDVLFAASVCGDEVVRLDLDEDDPEPRRVWAVDDPGGISYNPFAKAGWTVAVARPGGKDVQLFTDEGELVRTQRVGGTVPDVQLDDFSVLAAVDRDRDVLRLYGRDGREFRTLGGPGDTPGRLRAPVALDQFWQFGGALQGNFLIADARRAQRWDTKGATSFAVPDRR